MREHDREQILVLFTVEPAEDYLARGALAVARLAGGTGARGRHGNLVIEVGASGAHVCKVELEGGELLILSDEPLEGEGERAARFGASLLLRGLALADRLGDDERELERRLDATTLSPRERELAKLVVRGASTKEIASAMELTEATVRTYVKRVLAKVGVRSRLQLAAWLQDHPLASEG